MASALHLGVIAVLYGDGGHLHRSDKAPVVVVWAVGEGSYFQRPSQYD